MKKVKFFFFLSSFLLLLFMCVSCSIRKTVIKVATPLVGSIEKAFYYEPDTEIARNSLPGVLKIAEGLYYYYPESPYIKSKLCFLHAAYTFAFIDETPYDDFDPNYHKNIKQINQGYMRSVDFGLKNLNSKIPGFSDYLTRPKMLKKHLASLKGDYKETLFWLVFSKALILFNSTHDPKLAMELEGLVTICRYLEKQDPGYLYGSVYAVLEAIYGGRSDAIGGNRKKCDLYYEKALAYSQKDGKILSLIPDYVYLRYVSILDMDDKNFNRLSEKILGFEADTYPEFIFINKIIQKKTESLVRKKKFFF